MIAQGKQGQQLICSCIHSPCTHPESPLCKALGYRDGWDIVPELKEAQETNVSDDRCVQGPMGPEEREGQSYWEMGVGRKGTKLSHPGKSGQAGLLGRQRRSRLSRQRDPREERPWAVMYSRNHQLHHLATFITTTTTIIANIIGMLCAKHCSKALYVLIHLISPPITLQLNLLLAPFFRRKNWGTERWSNLSLRPHSYLIANLTGREDITYRVTEGLKCHIKALDCTLRAEGSRWRILSREHPDLFFISDSFFWDSEENGL